MSLEQVIDGVLCEAGEDGAWAPLSQRDLTQRLLELRRLMAVAPRAIAPPVEVPQAGLPPGVRIVEAESPPRSLKTVMGVHVIEALANVEGDDQTVKELRGLGLVPEVKIVERPSRRKTCEVCRGSGEVETGIGMVTCGDCRGCGKTRASTDLGLEPEFEPLLKLSNEYASLMLQWSVAMAGSQETADLHATFRARSHDAAKLFEKGLVGKLIEAYLEEKTSGC